MPSRITKEQWLKRFSKIHGNRYDYFKSIFIDGVTKIEILCSKHGPFWQSPSSHYIGRGCFKCGLETKTITSTKRGGKTARKTK